MVLLSMAESRDRVAPFFYVMACPAEMERELPVGRIRAGLNVACQLGRRGSQKRQITESTVKLAKKVLASGVLPRNVASNLLAAHEEIEQELELRRKAFPLENHWVALVTMFRQGSACVT